MIDFVVLQTALVNLVKTSSGLGGDAVFMSDQNGPSPQPSPYVTIWIGDLLNVGIDGTSWDYSADRDLGAEIVRTSRGMRKLMIRFQAFTPATVGSATARNILATLQANLGLPSYRAMLNQVGLGVLNQGDVKWVPKINNTDFEGRAVLEVLCCIPQSATDATGYIETVEATPTLNGVQLPPVEITD